MHDPVYVDRKHIGPFAWTDEQWRLRCAGVRTSYNPDHDLNHNTLTLRPSDPRWLDFVFWSLNNKINEHQFEAFGGTGWRGPTERRPISLGARIALGTRHSAQLWLRHRSYHRRASMDRHHVP